MSADASGRRTHETRPSLAASSAAQLAADLTLFLSALGASVVTARWLGPAGKGALSVLLLLSQAILLHICTFGFRDAVVVMVGQRRVPVSRMAQTVVAPMLLTTSAGAAVLLAISYPADWHGIRGAVLLAGALLMIQGLADIGESLLNAQERLVLTNSVRATASLVTALLTFVLLVPLGSGLVGAVAAVFAAQVLRLGLLGVALRRNGIRGGLRWDGKLLFATARIGGLVAGSYLIVVLADRLDQLVVYVLVGEAAAGLYSVSLTVGGLVGFAASALSASSFPRMSSLAPSEADDLTERVARLGLVGSLGTGAALAIVVPVAMAPVFGEDFSRAVPSALVLLLGGVFWGLEWVLARAAAARGHADLLVKCFGSHVVAMLALDFLLIPVAGIEGAAAASVVAALVGLSVCFTIYRRRFGGVRLARLIPRSGDVLELVHVVHGLLRQLRTSARI